MDLTRTRDAIAEYDRVGHMHASRELGEAVGTAFGEDTKAFNNPATCRDFIRPGPPVPSIGHKLSFVRAAVQDWEERTAQGENTDFQPRYIAYARDHGRTPEEMREHDRNKMLFVPPNTKLRGGPTKPDTFGLGKGCAGGRMLNFILWIPKAWAAWAKESGENESDCGWSDRQHEAFDAWLASTDREPVKIPG
jgi:hypothetical protein